MNRGRPERIHLFEGTILRATLPAGPDEPRPGYVVDGVTYRTLTALAVTHDDGSAGLDVQVEADPPVR